MHKRKAFVTISIVLVIVTGICLFLLLLDPRISLYQYRQRGYI